LRAALAWSRRLAGPRTEHIADLLRSLGVDPMVDDGVGNPDAGPAGDSAD
jgi:hypothetical protein